MRRKYKIYTDASVKKNHYTIAVVITRDNNIVTVLYKKFSERVTTTKAEHEAVMYAREYMRKTYCISKDDYTIYTDCKSLTNALKGLVWVRGHVNYKNATWKHKYNCLADRIARHGLNNWRKWWYNHKL